MPSLAESLRKSAQANAFLCANPEINKEFGQIYGIESGIPLQGMLELSGLPGSGRTAVWLNFASDALLKGYKIMYISCNYRHFPLDRMATLLSGKMERYTKSITTQLVQSLNQFHSINFADDEQIIIIDGYETLVRSSWSKQLQNRASQEIVRKLLVVAQTKFVIATCGSFKYQVTPEIYTIRPALQFDFKLQPIEMIRIQLYANTDSSKYKDQITKERAGEPKRNFVANEKITRWFNFGLQFELLNGNLCTISENPKKIEPVPLSLLTSIERLKSPSVRNSQKSSRLSSPVSGVAAGSPIKPRHIHTHAQTPLGTPLNSKRGYISSQLSQEPVSARTGQIPTPSTINIPPEPDSKRRALEKEGQDSAYTPNPRLPMLSQGQSQASQFSQTPSHRRVFRSTQEIPKFEYHVNSQKDANDKTQDASNYYVKHEFDNQKEITGSSVPPHKDTQSR